MARRVGFLLFLLVWTGTAQEPPEEERLLEMGLEELLQVDVVVTTAARRPVRTAATAAAAYAITGESLRRSGYASLAEALRLAPAVHVARVDRSHWAVSVRGFSHLFANKLLVLVDGRSVYTPLFSGVFWDVQDTFLADVDRIEVIRGPGATLWGANAVNGVIHVITKNARETQGDLLRLGLGTERRAYVAYRHGGRLGAGAYYRVYGKVFAWDRGRAPGGAHDDGRQFRTGFRVDWQAAPETALTVTGAAYRGHHGQRLEFFRPTPPFAATWIGDTEVAGGHLLGRLERDLGDWGLTRLQLYYDVTQREIWGGYREDRQTGDLDLQHTVELLPGQRLTLGLGYRFTRDRIRSTPAELYLPARDTHTLAQVFLRNDFPLVADRLLAVLGARLERNDFTGLEFQPTARLRWTPGKAHTVWAALSQAVRTPSRTEDSAHFTARPRPGPAPGSLVFARLQGNRDLRAEKTWAAEAGYRLRPQPALALDVALFFQRYRDLIGLQAGRPFTEPWLPPGGMILPLRFANRGRARSYGFEVAAEWRPLPRLHLQGTYAFLRLHAFPEGDAVEEASPRHLATLWCRHDLGRGWALDGGLRYVDRLPALRIPAYVELDLRLAWRPSKRVELELVGSNLLDPRHPEFRSTSVALQMTEVEREVFLGVLLWF